MPVCVNWSMIEFVCLSPVMDGVSPNDRWDRLQREKYKKALSWMGGRKAVKHFRSRDLEKNVLAF